MKVTRILHGPENIAGMASVIASEQAKMGIKAQSVCLPSNFDYVPDFWLAQDTPPNVSFSRFYLQKFWQYDVYNFYYDRTYFGTSFRDIRWLQRLGKKVILTFLGCDIRDPDGEIARGPLSMCAHCQKQGCSPNRADLRAAAQIADQVFVTTPDLKRSLPQADWLPLTCDGQAIRDSVPQGARPYVPGDPLRIFHAPTDRTKKGTHYLEQIIGDLRAKGLKIDYITPETLQGRDAVWQMAASAHVAVDQLLSGVYGTFAVEMMAANIPVISWLDPDLWGARALENGPLSFSPQTLSAGLERIIYGEIDLTARAYKARQYYEGVHDPAKVAKQALAGFAP